MQERIFILAIMLVICFVSLAGLMQINHNELSKQIRENRIILDAIRKYLSEQLKNSQK